MKVYRNSIYIFFVMSLISLILAAYLEKISAFYSNVVLGILGSSLITLFSALIFYFYEKEKIIKSLGIKCVGLYGLLNRFIKDIPGKEDVIDGKVSMSEMAKYYNHYANAIKENSIRDALVNYSGLLSSTFFVKYIIMTKLN